MNENQTNVCERKGNCKNLLFPFLTMLMLLFFGSYAFAAAKEPLTSITKKRTSLLEAASGIGENTNIEKVYKGSFVAIERENYQNDKKAGMTIKGRIVDSDNLPLAGATVSEKDTGNGVVADSNGSYAITITKPNSVLVFTYIGMQNEEVKVGKQIKIDMVLKPDVSSTDEVVITGIYMKAKESYTGAATMVTAKELEMSGNRNIMTTLRNLDPSFNLMESLNLGSDPNRIPGITIRGTSSLSSEVRSLTEESQMLNEANQPLFILDGFEISTERFMDLDEGTIASITILKDAGATAIYGSRGSNGVVVITSKMPLPGKLTVSYSLNANLETPDLTSYNLMNAMEKLEFEKASGLFIAGNSKDQITFNAIYNARQKEMMRGVNTDWLHYPVRTGLATNHSLSLSGGDQSFRYSARAAYRMHKGVMKGSERGTFNGNLLISYRFKNLSFKNDIVISSTQGKNSPYGAYSQYGALNPYWRPYDDDGNIKKLLEKSNDVNGREDVPNPLYNAILPQKDNSKNFSLINNLSIEYNPIESLRIAARFNVTYSTRRGDKYLSAKHTEFDGLAEDEYDQRGSYVYSPGESTKYEADITVQYHKDFGKHAISAGASYNLSSSHDESYSVKGVGLTAPNADYLGMANRYAPGRPSSKDLITRRLGGNAMFNYTYDRRYIVDGSITLEGSSQFGADRRLAPFWSVGLGWNVGNEKFFENQDVLTSFRMRLSYGSTGSQGFDPYQAITSYKTFEGKGYNRAYGVYLMGIGNPELGWQKTDQVNFGIDFTILDNRLRFTFDTYSKLTKDLLSEIYLPTASGFDNYKANVGELSNKGYEFSVNWTVLKSNDAKGLFLNVGTSAFHNSNKIKKISNSVEFLNDKALAEAGKNPSFLYKEGQSMNTLYAVKSLGIDPSNGQELFLTRDGQLTYDWDSKDKVACGTTEAILSGNLNLNVTYRNLSLNAIFGYQFGGKSYNHTLISKVENVDQRYNADRRVLHERWRKPGDVASYKGIANLTTTNASSRFIMNDDVFELRNVSLSYVLPGDWTYKYLYMSRVVFSCNTEDLFRIATIKQERGLTYPFSRKFSFSLNVTF